eukprot:COSAG02_NODE_483_length_21396_cov_20.544801_10_plen_88_part_00
MIGAPTFPDGVKFLIGVFPDLFGTVAGRVLQDWAIKWVWSSSLSSCITVGCDYFPHSRAFSSSFGVVKRCRVGCLCGRWDQICRTTI